MSRLLINEPPLMVLPSLAVSIGLNEAIFVQQLHYLLQMSQNERDGSMWVYNSMAEWAEVFPFLSERTIQRIITSLKKSGVIEVTNKYNRMKMDKTYWYSINYEELDKLASPSCQNGTIDMPDCHEPECQNGAISSCQNGTTNNHKNKTTHKTTNKRVTQNVSDSKFDVTEFLKGHNVSDLVIESFLSHRKNKKADNSPVAMNAFVREAQKANISVEKALEITIVKNWVGFNASWKWQDNPIAVGVNQPMQGKPVSKQQAVEDYNKSLLEKYGG